jgi:ribosome modulation factor
MMKRQKRDRQDRAHAKGYQAVMAGRSKENCPHTDINMRSEWLGGWRAAIIGRQEGWYR